MKHKISTYLKAVILLMFAIVFSDIASAGVVHFEETGTSWSVSRTNTGWKLSEIAESTQEDKNDGSGMSAPYNEYRCSGESNAITTSTSITHSTLHVDNAGKYIVSLHVRAYNKIYNKTANSYPTNITVTANNVSVKLADVCSTFSYKLSSSQNRRGIYGDVDIPIDVDSKKTVDIKITIGNNSNCYWLSFKNLTVSTLDMNHYKGIVSEMGTPPAGLQVDYKTKADDPRLNDGVQLQRTHEYVHDIYVLPGASYTLEPFSDYHTNCGPSNAGYKYTYNRWFDYCTDSISPRIVPDSDYPSVNIANKGYFGGPALKNAGDTYSKNSSGSRVQYTAPNNPNDSIFDIIAIDVSNSAGSDTYKNGRLNEPTLQFRHIFVIHNAQKLAEEMSASKEANDAYINRTRIKLMCPAGTPFQYPLPNFEYRGWGTSAKPTGFYYKKAGSKGAVEYAPVNHYRIELLKVNADGSTETVGSTTSFYAFRADGETTVGNSLSKSSSTTKPESDNEQTLCGKFQDNLVYAYKCIDKYDRAMYLKKPQVGKYIIRIYAVDVSSDTPKTYTSIHIYGSTTDNLLLQEYELDVMSDIEAAMLTEAELYPDPKDKPKDFKYEHQQPEVMKELYGDPAIEINFDEIQSSDCELDASGDGYYRWPREWENSSYAFGYKERYDYNMYVVANRSKYVPYKKDDNIYDRLYADTDGKQKGFFYYVNAASDPGRMALLNIGKEMCTNTRIYVSAWVCEMNTTNYEAANLVFSFRGVKKDGSETVLNSYVTGYVNGGANTISGYRNSTAPSTTTYGPQNRGKWMHVYYSFLPNALSTDFDHYVITLQNNCTSSQGADYAIDDIECYVRKLAVYAKQAKPVCNHTKSTDLQMSVDFDHMLEAFNIEPAETKETGKNKTLYYCFLEKAEYEKAMADPSLNYVEAFNKALVRDTYGKDAPSTYGTLHINTYFENNDSCKVVGANRSLVFPANVTDEQMKINGRYLVAMIDSAMLPTPGHVPDAVDFDVQDPCSNVSEFGVTFSGEVKIDGLLDSEQEGAELCLNQTSPPITIDLNGINKLDESVFHMTSPNFDWYLGTINDYEAAVYNDVALVNSLLEFRTLYPSASLDDCKTKPVSGQYTKAMKECILHFAVDEGKLLMLRNTGYVSLEEQYQDPFNPGDQRIYSITAIPINPDPGNKNLSFCLDPIQINTFRSANTPHMLDGDDHGIVAYPVAMEDVPLRIGLTQLRKCSNLTVSSKTGNISAPSGELLYVPLREIRTATTGVTKLKKADSDDYIYLASSDDPLANDASSGAIEPSGGGLKYIGRVKTIYADKTSTENVCEMAFLEGFKFREGYYYTIKFNFEEDNKDAADSKACPGDVRLTIKVVPEYQMWTGAVSRNWNDDRNWRRVTRAELFNPGTSVVGNDYVSDGGTNDNLKSYVPADFTKVIIPAGGTVPYMYNLRYSDNLDEVTFAGYGVEEGYIRSMTTGKDEIAPVPYDTLYDEVGMKDEYACIAEDMSSVDVTGGVACRPWYDHTCEQIHFMSGSELMDQRYLYYEKAWVDMELEPGRWHTVSSPLAKVVAGDFYIPTDGARQNTPLFQDINYDTKLNDRFAPAVYQRSWNAANTKVVKIDGSTENTAVKLDWSYVYNDVNVNYDAGIGFTVKPDVSRLAESKRPEKVKFRFPKDDVKYTYYNPENKDGGNAENVRSDALVDGKRVGKLININSEYGRVVGGGATETSYFLIGNPFMCHLNMAKFFAANDKLKPRYWTVTAAGQNVAIMDEKSDGFVSTISDATLLPPGVGFFVELAEGEADAFQPVFTSDMMAYVEASAEPALTSDASGLLRISLSDGDGYESALILSDSPLRQIGSAEALFDSNLSDEPMVYATIDKNAVSIGSLKAGDMIPVGVSGIRGWSELKISGVNSCVTSMSVYDAVLGTTQPLTQDMTLPLDADGVRYYIVAGSDIDMDVVDAVAINVDGNRLVVEAHADASLDYVLITDASGRSVTESENAGSSYTAIMNAGIYVVTVKSGNSEYSSKVSIF